MHIRWLVPPFVLVAACSAGLSDDADAACALAGAPVGSASGRAALRTRAEALPDDNVTPKRVGQAYFMLRQAAMQVPPASDLAGPALTRSQADLASACEDAGFHKGE